MWPIHQDRSLTRPAQHSVQGLTAGHEASHASVRQGVSPKVVLPGMGFRITICLKQRLLPPVKAQFYWCLAVRQLILRWIIADLLSGLPTVKEFSNLSPNILSCRGNYREGIESRHIRSIDIATSLTFLPQWTITIIRIKDPDRQDHPSKHSSIKTLHREDTSLPNHLPSKHSSAISITIIVRSQGPTSITKTPPI